MIIKPLRMLMSSNSESCEGSEVSILFLRRLKMEWQTPHVRTATREANQSGTVTWSVPGQP